MILFGEARLRGDANYTRVSRGARRAAVRYELGRATLPVLARLAAVVAVGVGIPVGMLDPLVHGEQQRRRSRAASGNLQYLWPATRDVGPARRRGGAAWRCVLALPVARARGPPPRRACRRSSSASTYLSFALPDLVAAIALAYAASHYARFLYGSFALLVFAEAMLFVPFAVVAHARHARTDRAGARGLGARARRRPARDASGA